MTGTGKPLTRESPIIVAFSIIINPFLFILSIIIISYSFIIGQLLWGLIVVLQIAILWVLIYRLSKKVKEEHYDYSKRPTGVTVLAILYALFAFSEILFLIKGDQHYIFGVTLSGVSAQLVYLISILTGIYLTYGFIKLLKLAWIIAIIFEFYGVLNTLIRISPYMPFGTIGAMFRIMLSLIIITYILGKADYFRN